MANKKMTLEEKLREAIVEDVPYEVPDNWVWSSFGSVIKLISGRDVSGKLCNEEKKGIPYILGSSNIKDGKFIAERWIENPVVVAEENDILISCKGTIGKTIIAKDKINISRQIMAIRCDNNIELKYIKFFIDSYVNTLIDQSKGLIPGITREDILNIKVPIPPLKEQQRIVDKIESLFEKLDKAKELIEEARDDFEKRKQSITEKALMGEYVSGVKLTEVELGNILSFKNGMSKRSGKEGNETKVLRLADVSGDVISSENARSMLLTDKEMANYKVEDGELLIIRVNGTKKNVGKAIEYKGENICAYCDHLIRIDCSQVNKTYIKYLINSDSVRRQIDELIVSSAGQNTISQSSLNKIKAMWVENNKGQEKIVGIINTLINKEKIIEELTALEEQIELIKKSILAKAFRGQLGTNCPEEESALELLKEILSKE